MLNYPDFCEYYQRRYNLCAKKRETQLLIALLITVAVAWIVAILTHFDRVAMGIMAFILLIVLGLWNSEAFK